MAEPWKKYTPEEPQTAMAAPWSRYSVPPAAARGVLGKVDDTVRMIAKGATFGFADEIAAKMDESIGHGDYESNVAAQRARDDQIARDMPVTSMIANLFGAVVSPGAKLIAAGANAVRTPGYLNYALQGAAGGSLAGAGESTEGNRAFGAVTGGTFGAAGGAAFPAAVNAGAAIGRGVVNKFSAPQTQAGRRLMNALIRDGLTPEEAAVRIATLGEDAVIADLGGNVRGLAEAAATVPGKALKAAEGLATRQAGQGDRLMSDALRIVGAESIDDLIAQRSAAARPYYQQAFSRDVHRTLKSDLMKRLQTRPDFQEGVRAGIKDLLDEAAITGEDLRAFNTYFDGADLNDPNLVLVKEPTLRIIDAAKRGMDRLLYDNPTGKYVRENGELTQSGMPLQQMCDALMKEDDMLTAGTPEGDAYKIAREKWGGPTDIINGLSLIRRTIENTRDNTDVTGKLFGSKAARDKLEKLFGKQPVMMKEFANSVDREKTFAATNRAMGNSRTAYRHAAQADMADDAVDAAFSIAENPTVGNATSQLLSAGRNWFRTPPSAVADELAPLFSSDPTVRADAMRAVTDLTNGQNLLNQAMRPLPKTGSLLQGAARAGGYSGGLLGSYR